MRHIHLRGVAVVSLAAGVVAVWLSASLPPDARGAGAAAGAAAAAGSGSFELPPLIDGDAQLVRIVRTVPAASARAYHTGGRVTRYDLHFPRQGVGISLVRDRARGAAERWRVAPRAYDTRGGRALRPEDLASRFPTPEGAATGTAAATSEAP